MDKGAALGLAAIVAGLIVALFGGKSKGTLIGGLLVRGKKGAIGLKLWPVPKPKKKPRKKR